MNDDTKLPPAGALRSGDFLGSHESGRQENERFVLRWGYTITNDHATTGQDWYLLVDKTTGESHSGPHGLLWQIFLGRKTLENLYA